MWKKKYEGRIKKRVGTTRTDELRKWDDERSRGMKTLQTSDKIKPTDPLRVTMSVEEKQENEVIIQTSRSVLE